MLPPGAVVRDVRELPAGFRPSACPPLPPPRSVLMVRPGHFDVVYAINPHMTAGDGTLRRPDRARAAEQWERLRRTFESLGWPVTVIDGVPGLPDMVFAANQAFPFPPVGARGPGMLPSRMRHPERAAEVAHFEDWFRAAGREVRGRCGDQPPFLEGNGDLLWFPGRRLLLGGHGFRTEVPALAEAAAAAAAPLVAFTLGSPGFYHLDTCLAPLDGTRALWVPEAFDEAGRRLLAALFPRLITVPGDEGTRCLAANAHCPDGRHVIIDSAAAETMKLLQSEGFRVIPLDTSEFLKAGGSVFCMKLMLW